MKISVITPNYNHAQFLEKSIQSVLNQTQVVEEYILIEDASTDNSKHIIKKFKKDFPIKTVFHSKNQGILKNLNEGLKLASGDFILFLAADDFLEPSLIEEYKKYLEEYPDVGFICSRSYKVDIHSNKIAEYGVSKHIPTGFIPASQAKHLIFRYGPWFYGNTILLNRKKALEGGGFNPDLLSYTDGYVYLSLALRCGIVYIDKVLSNCRRHEESYSMDTYRNIRKLSHIKKEVLNSMKSEPQLFTKFFIKRWIQRWEYLEFNATLISHRHLPSFVKLLLSAGGYLYYRWFDLLNLRLLDVKAFLRECRQSKVSS